MMTELFPELDAALLIHEILDDIKAWKLDRTLLTDRISGLSVFQAQLPPEHPDKDLCSRAVSALSAPRNHEDIPSYLTSVHEMALALNELARQSDGWDEAGRLEGKLHSIVNLTSHQMIVSERILACASRIETMDSGDTVHPTWKELRGVALAVSTLDDAVVDNLAALCENVIVWLPDIRTSTVFSPRSIASPLGDRVCILIAEDDPVWLPEAKQVCDSVATLYRSPTKEVRVETALTYQDATNQISSFIDQHWSIILVLDLGLPRDVQELNQAESDRTSVGRRWGRELLHNARRYQNRHHVIVFTVVASYPKDFETALNCGITPEDFVLKDRDARERLAVSLQNTLEPRRAPRLEIVQDSGGRIRLNGMEVPLTLTPFRVLSIMAQHPRTRHTVEQLADDLDSAYEGEYDQAADARLAVDIARRTMSQEGLSPDSLEYSDRLNALKNEAMGPLNALECWQRTLHQDVGLPDNEGNGQGGKFLSAKETLVSFYERCSGYTDQAPWRWALAALDLTLGSPMEWDDEACIRMIHRLKKLLTIARIRPKSFNPASLHDHIYTIRQQLYLATGIDPNDVILTQSDSNGYWYQLTAEPMFVQADEVIGDDLLLLTGEPCRVLVVEDEPGWRNDVKRILSSGLYDVETSSSREEAIKTAQDFLPHIVCLDLNLLPDQSLDSPSSTSCKIQGLEILHEIQGSNPRIKAVILSAYSNNIQLRIEAARRGVGIRDFVAKQPSEEENWEAKLLRAVWQCEQELRRGTLLPPPESTPFVSVELHEQSAKSRGIWVYVENGERNWVPLMPKEFELLSLFRDYGSRPVERDELIEGLYGDNWFESHGAFVNWLRRLKEALTERGMKLPKSAAGKVGNRLITESAGYYCIRFKLT